MASADLPRLLARGATGSLSAGALAVGTGLLLQAALVGLLGVEAFGELTTAAATLALLGVAAWGGLELASLRFVAAAATTGDPAAIDRVRRAGEGYAVLAACGIAAAGGAVLALAPLGLAPGFRAALAWGVALLPLEGLLNQRAVALQALRRVFVARLAHQVIRPLVAILVLAGWSAAVAPPGAAGGQLALGVGLVGGLVFVTAIWRRTLARAAAAPADALPPADAGTPRCLEVPSRRELLVAAGPLHGVSLLRVLLNQLDVLLIGALLGTREAGLYAVASRLARLVTFGQNMLSAIVAPLLAAQHARGQLGELGQTMRLAARWAGWWALPAAALLALAGRPLLAFFGPEFVVMSPCLIVLAVGQLLNALAGPVGYLANMTGQQRANLGILLVVVAGQGLATLALLPTLGALGAALATATATTGKNLWTWHLARTRVLAPAPALPPGDPASAREGA